MLFHPPPRVRTKNKTRGGRGALRDSQEAGRKAGEGGEGWSRSCLELPPQKKNQEGKRGLLEGGLQMSPAFCPLCARARQAGDPH